MAACEPLLAALDVPSAAHALRLADALDGLVGGYKVGSQLFTAEGPSIVRALADRGARVFLDLKFHDIPNTVAHAVASAARLRVWMLTVHASGGVATMRAAVKSAIDTAADLRRPPPLVIAVTVLTSLDDQALGEVGVHQPVLQQVQDLGALAHRAGVDGLVASPREVAILRERHGAGFTIVTPGIRSGAAAGGDDQARTMSAAEAMRAGASYLVVGRPIVAAPDPRAAAARLADEIASAAAP